MFFNNENKLFSELLTEALYKKNKNQQSIQSQDGKEYVDGFMPDGTFTLGSNELKIVDSYANTWGISRLDTLHRMIQNTIKFEIDDNPISNNKSLENTQKKSKSYLRPIYDIDKKEKRHLKAIIRELIDSGNLKNEEFCRSYNISNDALLELLTLIKNEDYSREMNKPAGKHYNQLTKGNIKHLKKAIRENILTGKMSHEEFCKKRSITKGTLDTLLEQVIEADNISAKTLASLNNQAPSSSKKTEYDKIPTKKKNEHKELILKMLHEQGAVPRKELAETLNVNLATIKKYLTELSPENGPHIQNIAQADFKHRKALEILEYKRKEIYSDEEIMKLTGLPQERYEGLLQEIYNGYLDSSK